MVATVHQLKVGITMFVILVSHFASFILWLRFFVNCVTPVHHFLTVHPHVLLPHHQFPPVCPGCCLPGYFSFIALVEITGNKLINIQTALVSIKVAPLDSSRIEHHVLLQTGGSPWSRWSLWSAADWPTWSQPSRRWIWIWCHWLSEWEGFRREPDQDEVSEHWRYAKTGLVGVWDFHCLVVKWARKVKKTTKNPCALTMHQTNNPSSWWVLHCELGGTKFWLD